MWRTNWLPNDQRQKYICRCAKGHVHCATIQKYLCMCANVPVHVCAHVQKRSCYGGLCSVWENGGVQFSKRNHINISWMESMTTDCRGPWETGDGSIKMAHCCTFITHATKCKSEISQHHTKSAEEISLFMGAIYSKSSPEELGCLVSFCVTSAPRQLYSLVQTSPALYKYRHLVKDNRHNVGHCRPNKHEC